MHLAGFGVERNHKKAINYFTKAAEQGSAEAQFHLGSMHARGVGVKRDFTKAFYNFNLAAHQGELIFIYVWAIGLTLCFVYRTRGGCVQPGDDAARGRRPSPVVQERGCFIERLGGARAVESKGGGWSPRVQIAVVRKSAGEFILILVRAIRLTGKCFVVRSTT